MLDIRHMHVYIYIYATKYIYICMCISYMSICTYIYIYVQLIHMYRGLSFLIYVILGRPYAGSRQPESKTLFCQLFLNFAVRVVQVAALSEYAAGASLMEMGGGASLRNHMHPATQNSEPCDARQLGGWHRPSSPSMLHSFVVGKFMVWSVWSPSPVSPHPTATCRPL